MGDSAVVAGDAEPGARAGACGRAPRGEEAGRVGGGLEGLKWIEIHRHVRRRRRRRRRGDDERQQEEEEEE